jgi:hypothetical protein
MYKYKKVRINHPYLPDPEKNRQIIFYDAVRRKQTVFFFLWHGGLLKPYVHWPLTFFRGNRAYSSSFCSMVEMSFSSYYDFLNVIR